MNTLEQGVLKRFEDGSERRNRLVVQAREAEAQLAASQLAAEGIVALDTTNPDTFLGRLGQAISPHTEKVALFASAVLAIISTSYWLSRSSYDSGEFPTNSTPVTISADQKPSQESPTIVKKLDQRPSRTTYISEDQNLFPGFKGAHERSLVLAREILERIKLDFLIHEVVTVEPQDPIPPTIKKLFGPFVKWAGLRGWVEFYPEGIKMFLDPYLLSEEKVGRRTIVHESGHGIDPDLNPYLANFISPNDLSALQKVTAKLKDIYWQNYFPDDQKTVSSMEAYYRKMYTNAVGARFGGSEDLGKSLMLAYLQDPHQFDGWLPEDRDFLRERIKFLGSEAFAENVANFALDPLGSDRDFPDLAKTSFELGKVLDVAATYHK